MVTSFLIASLVIFSISAILNLISLGVVISDGNNSKAIQFGITVFIYLIFITWNIFALVSI